MNNIFFLLIFLFFLKYGKPQKTVEINFYRNISKKDEPNFSELIKNNIYTSFELGSSQKKVNFPINFGTPYFSISLNELENSQTYTALEPNFTFFSKTEFVSAQKAEEKIKINEKISIDDFKFLCDKKGKTKFGINLNYDNEEIKDFIFIKELLRKNLIETQDIKILYNENNFNLGKIIFGASPQYKIPMHVEQITIFCFRVSQVTYQGEDFTTEIALDFNSAGIVAPAPVYKIFEKFFEPFMKNNTCKYIILPNSYDSSIFCNESFDSFEQFGKIYFNLNDFNFKHSFILEGKELFLKIKDGYIFLIRTYLYYTAEKWVLGLPFFGKYPVTFNLEKKMIGFDINNVIKDVDDNNNKENNRSITTWILLSILIVLIIIVIIFNIYFFSHRKKRKVRANELDENIIYNEKKNDDNNLGI